MLHLRPRTDYVRMDDCWGLPEPLAYLLHARGVSSAEEARVFLHPSVSDLHDPFLMRGMDTAYARIRHAIDAKEHITVYGDYDADGCCATALLLTALQRAGACADFYLPDRHTEGYGLNCEALKLIRQKSSLVISVDCGIVSFDEADFAREIGLSLLITDHHEPADHLPVAEAILNPLLGEYPFRRLCGAGVAFKIAQALLGDDAMDLLELAALATVADLVPLLGENRVIVSLGLSQMQNTHRIGLRALLNTCCREGKPITSGQLGFQVAPRINACGRLGDASRAVRLLMTVDESEASALSAELNSENACRQQMENAVFEQAEKLAVKQTNFVRDRIIIVCGEGWNSGVVGLAASKLVERFNWPVIVFSRDQDTCVGSARSIPGVNIHKALTMCQSRREDLFIRFGGHAQAAGMTVLYENLPVLQTLLNESIAEIAEKDAYLPSAVYDASLHLEEVTPELVRGLDALAPTGWGNPSPVFWIENAYLPQCRPVGKDGSHLKLLLQQNESAVDGIWFGGAAYYEKLPKNVDALCSLSMNEYMGRSVPQLEVSRLFAHDDAQAFALGCQSKVFAYAALSGHLPPPGAIVSLSAELGALLRTRPQGILLAAYTPEGALNCVRFLQERGLSNHLDYCFGHPDDIRRFNTLCAFPDKDLYDQYPEVYCVDADLFPAFLRSWFPDRQALATLYKALGRPFYSLEELAAFCGLKEETVSAGLTVFEELSLIRFTSVPFSVHLLPQRKVNLEDSPTYSLFRLLAFTKEDAQ